MFIDISDRNRNIYITRFRLKLPVIAPLDLAYDAFEKFHIVQRSLSQWKEDEVKIKPIPRMNLAHITLLLSVAVLTWLLLKIV